MARLPKTRNENGRGDVRECGCRRWPADFSLVATCAMNSQSRTLEEFRTRNASVSGKFAVVGFDGFVDRIVHPVATRHGPGDAFTPMAERSPVTRLIPPWMTSGPIVIRVNAEI